jgi:hypothetical protein
MDPSSAVKVRNWPRLYSYPLTTSRFSLPGHIRVIPIAVTTLADDRAEPADLELGSLLADKTAGLTDPDDAPAAPEHPVSQTGDLWLLGRHRLLCGDSTVATDVERVLGGGEPHLMVTDPPYGVNYDAGWRSQRGVSRPGKALGKGR